MKLLVFLAVWKRPEITEICFKGLRRLRDYDRDRFSIDVLAVISERSMIPLCKEYDIKYKMFANSPLGAKKNAGLNEAFKHKWDYLLEIGSDDLVRNEILDIYEPYMKKGHPLLSLQSLIHMDTNTGEGLYFRTEGSFGGGRCIERGVLNKISSRVEIKANDSFMTNGVVVPEGGTDFIDGQTASELSGAGYVDIIGKPTHYLWRQDINRGMDNSSNYLFHKNGIDRITIPADAPLLLSMKSDQNITMFNPAVGPVYDPMQFLENVSEDEIESLFALQQIAA